MCYYIYTYINAHAVTYVPLHMQTHALAHKPPNQFCSKLDLLK